MDDKKTSLIPDYDVIIIGGGTSGVVAAIQSGRAGAKTLLVEKCGMLGGTITMGAVAFPGIFFAWGRQIIAGIGWELVTKTLKEENRSVPDPSHLNTLPIQHHIKINPSLFALICDEEVLKAGVDVLLHSIPACVKWSPGQWRLTICGKEGLREISTKVLIDCTGDANAVRLAGFPVLKQPELQPATPMVSMHGYDYSKLDKSVLRQTYLQAVQAGQFDDCDFGWGGAQPGDRLFSFLERNGENAVHVCDIDAGSSKGKSSLETTGHALVLKIYRWLKQQPGLENLTLSSMAPECGVRETVTIQGKSSITIKEYESGYSWPDAICYSFYPVDVHTRSGSGLIFRHLAQGVVPSIPRGALLPIGSRFLIAAGRHISGDREAHSAYRVQASCMAMGQAAGVMAALSAERNMDPEELPLIDIRELLRKYGAIVPE